jgi:hypothetical protein
MDIKYHLVNTGIFLLNIVIVTLLTLGQASTTGAKGRLRELARHEYVLLAIGLVSIAYVILSTITFNISLEHVYAASNEMNWTKESEFGQYLTQFNLFYYMLGKLLAFGVPILFLSILINSITFLLYLTSYHLIAKIYGFTWINSFYVAILMLYGNIIWLYYMQFYSIPSISFPENHGIIGLGLALLCLALLLARHYYLFIFMSLILLMSHPPNFLNMLSVVTFILATSSTVSRIKRFSAVCFLVLLLVLILPLNFVFQDEESLFHSYVKNWDYHRSPEMPIAAANFTIMIIVFISTYLRKRYFKDSWTLGLIYRIQILNFFFLLLTFFTNSFNQLSLYNILIFGRISNLFGLIIGIYFVLYISNILSTKIKKFTSRKLGVRPRSFAFFTASIIISIFLLSIPDSVQRYTPSTYSKTINEKRDGVCANLGNKNVLTNIQTDWVLRVCGGSNLISTSYIDWIPYKIGSIKVLKTTLVDLYGLDISQSNDQASRRTRILSEADATTHWKSLSTEDWDRLFCKYQISSLVTLTGSQIPNLEMNLSYNDGNYVVYNMKPLCNE